MSDLIENTRMLAETHGLKFKDCGGGHVQISGHGTLVNYWPLSKRMTAHAKGGESVQHCSPWDAVKLAISQAKSGMKPRKPSKNGPDFDLRPITTNPAGIRHIYRGAIPPWEFGGHFIGCASDNLRIQAYQLQTEADLMDAE